MVYRCESKSSTVWGGTGLKGMIQSSMLSKLIVKSGKVGKHPEWWTHNTGHARVGAYGAGIGGTRVGSGI